MKNIERMKQLEQQIGYQFSDRELLVNALTHSSYANEASKKQTPGMAPMKNNERLEFLGDAVLELVSSEYLYRNNPDMPEGDMTRTRASMVCEPALAFCAREIELGSYLLLGKGEQHTGGRDRDSVISDGLEALIGAIYLDGGFANAKEFITDYVLKDTQKHQLFYDSKTILQEMIQGNYEGEISYVLTGEEGPDHNKKFTVEVRVGEQKLGSGTGRSKKAAEQQAAYQAILRLKQIEKQV